MQKMQINIYVSLRKLFMVHLVVVVVVVVVVVAVLAAIVVLPMIQNYHEFISQHRTQKLHSSNTKFRT